MTKFNHLDRYAQEEISTDARKQARFRKGLSPVIRHDLNLHEFVNFEDLVNRSFRAEYGNEVFEESHKHAREFAPSSSSAPQKRRIWIPTSAIPSHLFARPSYMVPQPPPPNMNPNSYGSEPAIIAPPPDTRICYKCGHPGHIARKCSLSVKVDPRPRHDATPPKPSKAKSSQKSTSNSLQAKSLATLGGCVNQISVEEAIDTSDAILGTLPVNRVPTSVLFDPGASHSFMSESYALRHDLSFFELSTPMIIQTPGSRWQTNRVSHGNQIAIEGLLFLASLIALKSSDIDVILGMD